MGKTQEGNDRKLRHPVVDVKVRRPRKHSSCAGPKGKLQVAIGPRVLNKLLFFVSVERLRRGGRRCPGERKLPAPEVAPDWVCTSWTT